MSDAASRARLETLQVENPRLQRQVDDFPARSEPRAALEAELRQLAQRRAAAEADLYALRQRETAARDLLDRRRAAAAPQSVQMNGLSGHWWRSWLAWGMPVAGMIAAFSAMARLDPDHLPPLVPLAVVLLSLPVVLNLVRVARARGRRRAKAEAAVRAAARTVEASRAGDAPRAAAPERAD